MDNATDSPAGSPAARDDETAAAAFSPFVQVEPLAAPARVQPVAAADAAMPLAAALLGVAAIGWLIRHCLD